MQAAWRGGIDVTVLDDGGLPVAACQSLRRADDARLWRRQLAFSRSQRGYELAHHWLHQLHAARVRLLAEYEHAEAGELARGADELRAGVAMGHRQTTLTEAQLARRYWRAFGELCAVRPAGAARLRWRGRRLRPADNVVNAALNYGYGISYGVVRQHLRRRGLHPGLGIIHSEARGGEALVYDLIEPLRIGAERTALRLSRSGELGERHFEPRRGYLVGDAKTRVARTLYEWLHDSGPANETENRPTHLAREPSPYARWVESVDELLRLVRATQRAGGYANDEDIDMR